MTSLIPRTNEPETRLAKSEGPFAFSDHSSFHGTVGRAAIGAALGGLGAHVVTSLLGLPLAGSALLTLGITTGALATIAGRGRKGLRALFGGAIGAIGALLYTFTVGTWAPFGALLLGAACAPVLARGDSKWRIALTGAIAAGFAWSGLFVAEALIGSGILAGLLPSPLASMLSASAAGMFIGLASAPKHLARPLDAVEASFRHATSLQEGELKDVLNRALSVYISVRSDIAVRKEDDPSVGQLSRRVGELMMRILDIANQCRRIETDLAETPMADLEERIESLRRKASATDDPAATKTYLAAANSLDDQRRSFQAILRGRERVVARLHGNLALLERIRFSLLHMRSAHTERIGEGMFPLSDALEELSRELDATSLAVGEVYGQPSNEAETPRDALPPHGT